MSAKKSGWGMMVATLICLGVGACTPGKKDAAYGTRYDTAASLVSDQLPADAQYFSGESVTSLPEVKPAPAGRVHPVRLDVTHKIIEVADGVRYKAWTFGDEVPGPTIHVRVGDTVVFTLNNRTTDTVQVAPPMPHSIDFHAAMVSPQDKYHSILPGQSLTFEWHANYPGVFMYHCATPPVLMHLITGMYGMTIVEPREGYPTTVDREYALVQSEFYLADNPVLPEQGAFR